MTLGASIIAGEKSGFGVHALEVWQKNSHVKRQDIDSRTDAAKNVNLC